MSSASYLFVYGTLLGWSAHPMARFLRQHADLAGRALLPGRLYALPGYPALRLPQTSEDWVAGEVYRLRQPEFTLRKLDRYEGPDYVRLRRSATLESGHSVDCWVYVYRTALPRHRRIATGAWENSR